VSPDPGRRVRVRVAPNAGWRLICTTKLPLLASARTTPGFSRLVRPRRNSAGTDWGDQYFRTTPRFETSDERYKWLTTNLFVSEGRLMEGGGVEYRVYRIT
jgi:Protein of unknown function (DUF3237)